MAVYGALLSAVSWSAVIKVILYIGGGFAALYCVVEGCNLILDKLSGGAIAVKRGAGRIGGDRGYSMRIENGIYVVTTDSELGNDDYDVYEFNGETVVATKGGVRALSNARMI